MIRELQTQVASGADDKAILHWFEVKYGATVLAAPIRGGFDNAAWIIPIGVFLLATIGTFVVVWLWRKRAVSLSPAAVGHSPAAGSLSPQDAALRERIRRETEY
jgi:cytochrome c-type biogenesis protein CcmH